MTLICAICGETRESSAMAEFAGAFYCKDRPECVAQGRTKRLVVRALARPPQDTSNRFVVGRRGDDKILILVPVPQVMTTQDALNLAAWLVALADTSPGETDFHELLAAIQST